MMVGARAARTLACLVLLSTAPLVLSSVCCDGTSCTMPQKPDDYFKCPASVWSDMITTFPEDWYLNPIAQNFGISKQCHGGNKTYSTCTTDADCNGGACAPKATSAKTVVNQYMACCRHCVWDMQFPMGAPIQVTAGPLKNQSSELYMVPLLNCVNFPSEFAALDTNSDLYLSSAEFSEFFSALPNRELVSQGILNQTAVEWAADLNKDMLISYPEFVVLRHFWTPVLISNSGASPTADGSGASGPLGGFFYDTEMVSVWVTTANNILLRLYILNGWDSSATREPLAGEEADYTRNADLDGSGRISLEEHYFRNFADLDASGDVNATEFALSLYAATLTLANGTSRAARYAFADHDLDGSGAVSFLERKRLAADASLDGALDAAEWAAGDFPPDPAIFTQHASAAGAIGPAEYKLYEIYDVCTLYRWQRYNSPNASVTGIPWNYEACVLRVITFATAPFVNATGGGGGAVARRGRRDLAAASGAALSGFAPTVWGAIANGLGFSQTVTLAAGPENASALTLRAPAADGASGTVTFEVALLSLYADPPPEWACAAPLWPQDGFVIVVRAAPRAINLYLIVIDMVISPQFVNFFSSLFFLVLGVGHIIWLIELWGNGLQFRRFYSEGVIDGLWWAIVTQTTNGFGDKAPASLPGKAFAVFWMIFGLITFAIFAGQATSIVALKTAVNAISGFRDIAGLSVGTPAGTPGAALAQALAFTAAPCAGMGECVRQLLDQRTDAILAPRADVVHHFVAAGLNDGACGNPVMIVGDPLPLYYVPGAGPGLQACTYARGAYAGAHLAAAVSAAVAGLAADGTLAAAAAGLDPFQTVPDLCPNPPTYYVPLNAAAAGVLCFYVIGRYIERRRNREGVPNESVDMGDVAKSILALSRKAASQASMDAAGGGDGAAGVMITDDPLGAAGDAACAPGGGPSTAGAGAAAGAAAAAAEMELPPLDDVEELVAVARRVGLFHAMQSGSVRKMQRELRKQKNLLTSVVKLMLFTSAGVACGLAMVVGIMIAVWSDRIQLARYW